MVMKSGSEFAANPGDMPALKSVLAAQDDQSTLIAVYIDDIVIA
jgi:hypothetical protein